MSEGQFLLWPSVCYVTRYTTPHTLVATGIPSPFCWPRGGNADRAVEPTTPGLQERSFSRAHPEMVHTGVHIAPQTAGALVHRTAKAAVGLILKLRTTVTRYQHRHNSKLLTNSLTSSQEAI